MKKLLGLIVVIVALASFFADKAPDGLDKTAELLGFATKGVDHTSLMTGYTVPFISNASLSTVVAGMAGALLIWGIFFGISKMRSLMGANRQ